jgi:hypothetical protein
MVNRAQWEIADEERGARCCFVAAFFHLSSLLLSAVCSHNSTHRSYQFPAQALPHLHPFRSMLNLTFVFLGRSVFISCASVGVSILN